MPPAWKALAESLTKEQAAKLKKMFKHYGGADGDQASAHASFVMACAVGAVGAVGADDALAGNRCEYLGVPSVRQRMQIAPDGIQLHKGICSTLNTTIL